MKIAVDFDGTCTTHAYPEIGEDIGSVKVLRELVKNGHKLILFTMRSDSKNKTLTEAVNWFRDNKIDLYAIQKDKGQSYWTSSNKCYANLYIDDAALGCPLKVDPSLSDRPFADWTLIREYCVREGIIS